LFLRASAQQAKIVFRHTHFRILKHSVAWCGADNHAHVIRGSGTCHSATPPALPQRPEPPRPLPRPRLLHLRRPELPVQVDLEGEDLGRARSQRRKGEEKLRRRGECDTGERIRIGKFPLMRYVSLRAVRFFSTLSLLREPISFQEARDLYFWTVHAAPLLISGLFPLVYGDAWWLALSSPLKEIQGGPAINFCIF